MSEPLILVLECEIDGVHHVQLSAIAGKRLVGTASLFEADADTPQLCNLYVPVAARRKGIGTCLVREAICWADHRGKSVLLHVRPDNPARQLYEAECFEYAEMFEPTEDGSIWMIKVAGDGRLVRGPEPWLLP